MATRSLSDLSTTLSVPFEDAGHDTMSVVVLFFDWIPELMVDAFKRLEGKGSMR
jgi:hypothetical protein